MMSKHNAIVLLLVTVLVQLPVFNHAFAEDAVEYEPGIMLGEWDVEAGAAIDWYSKYIWRGQNLVDDADDDEFYGGFSLSIEL